MWIWCKWYQHRSIGCATNKHSNEPTRESLLVNMACLLVILNLIISIAILIISTLISICCTLISNFSTLMSSWNAFRKQLVVCLLMIHYAQSMDRWMSYYTSHISALKVEKKTTSIIRIRLPCVVIKGFTHHTLLIVPSRVCHMH